MTTTPTMTSYEAALAYAARGWRVFPVEAGGKFSGLSYLDATCDPIKIAEWWSPDMPTARPGAGIALALRPSGLICVDVDVGVDKRTGEAKQGTQTLRLAESRLGPLPRDIVQRSGSGGTHIVMADPSPGPQGWTRRGEDGGQLRGKLDAAGFGPHVDVKCSGHIVVEPSGRYQWIALADVAPPVPAAWLEVLRKPAAEIDARSVSLDEVWAESTSGTLSPRDHQILVDQLEQLERGRGGDATFRAIKAVFFDFGLGLEDGREYVEHWNRDCGKPYTAGQLVRQLERVCGKLGDDEDMHGNHRGWKVGLAEQSEAVVEAVVTAAAKPSAAKPSTLAAVPDALPAHLAPGAAYMVPEQAPPITSIAPITLNYEEPHGIPVIVAGLSPMAALGASLASPAALSPMAALGADPRGAVIWSADDGDAFDFGEGDDDGPPVILTPGAIGRVAQAHIKVGIDIERMTDEAMLALSDLDLIYVRAQQLVHVVRDSGAPLGKKGNRAKPSTSNAHNPQSDTGHEHIANDGDPGVGSEMRRVPSSDVVAAIAARASGILSRPAGTPVIVGLARGRLYELLCKVVRWTTFARGEAKATLPPAPVVAALEGRGQWPAFPPLDGIADAPVLRPDGTVLETPGYDHQTRMLYQPDVAYPPVPERPTRDEAVASAARIVEKFVDFPFTAPSDRAAALAFVLTLVGRTAIDGQSPMFGVSATTPGSGKGLLVDAISIIATGRAASKMTASSDEEEWRKSLLATALESPSMICIDNVDGQLGGPALASAITEGRITQRVLGKSQQVTASIRAVWSYTGNNVLLRGDLGRRVIPIDLDPACEHPEDRTGFRYPDLLEHLRDEHPTLVIDALTVLRAYDVADRPSHGMSRKGSFEAWDSLVRGACIWVGEGDPVAGVERIREQGDADLDNLRALMTAWRAALRDRGVTAAEVIDISAPMGASGAMAKDAKLALREALGPFLGDKPGRAEARELGYALRRLRGRVVDGLCFNGTKKARGVEWVVVAKGAVPPPEPGTPEVHGPVDVFAQLAALAAEAS